MNRSAKTRQQYLESATQFVAFLHEQDMPTTAGAIGRDHVRPTTPAARLGRYRRAPSFGRALPRPR
jgi:hypothetical protein